MVKYKVNLKFKEKGRIQRSRVLAKQILTKMNEEEVFTEKSKRKVYSIY